MLTQESIQADQPTVGKNAPARTHFKIAIYGQAEAGKTCYLAALSLPRIPNPRNFTATWMEALVDDEDRARTQNASRLSEAERASFIQGVRILTQARNALKSGKAPRPTEMAKDVLRYAFEFSGPEYTPPSNGSEVTSSNVTPTDCKYSVELIDYSGELLDTTQSNNEMAKVIRAHLRECDGLIVLAEAPTRGKSLGELSEDLGKIQVIFRIIAKSRINANRI